MPESYTQRGFAMYTQFESSDYDGQGNAVFSVQQSSLATESKVWIGQGDERAHLSVAEARKVRDALTEFIDGAEEADAAEDSYVDAAVRADQALKDIAFLWDWRVNQGQPFLFFREDVPTMRALLSKIPLEEIPSFGWVKQAREEQE